MELPRAAAQEKPQAVVVAEVTAGPQAVVAVEAQA
jgi:hypothetical protein